MTHPPGRTHTHAPSTSGADVASFFDLQIGHDILSAALRNTRDAEVFWTREEAITAASLDRREESAQQEVEGLALRVIGGGRVGHAVHLGPSARLAQALLLAEATKNACLGPIAPPTFCQDRESVPQVPTWDEELASLTDGDLRHVARHAAGRLRDMLGDVTCHVAVRRLIRHTTLLTRMTDRRMHKTLLQFRAHIGPLHQNGAHFVETWTSGRLPDDPNAPLGNIAWQASIARVAVPPPASPCRAVFGPRAVAAGLRWLCQALTGASILAGRSRWDIAMLGRSRVASERITVVDNPLRAWTRSSATYDAEGLPRVRRTLIDNGVLSSLLLDLSTAFQLELEPTAAAARDVNTPPEPAPSYLELTPGSDGFETLLAQCEGGIYIDGLDEDVEADGDGEFEIGATAAFSIRDGRPQGWIEGLRIRGNMYDLFARQVLAVGGDRIFTSSACCGSVAFKDVLIHA